MSAEQCILFTISCMLGAIGVRVGVPTREMWAIAALGLALLVATRVLP